MFKLNYRAKLSNQIGTVLGPNTFNEKFVVVGQDFDGKVTTLRLEIYRGE